MKKIITGILILFTVNSFAQSHTLKSEIDITRTNIDHIIEELSQRQIQIDFNSSDYLAQVNHFNLKVNNALKKFEHALEYEILKPANLLTKQIESIMASDSFSIDQKAVILAQRSNHSYEEFQKLAARYRTILKDLYRTTTSLEFQTNIEHKTYNSKKINQKVKVKIYKERYSMDVLAQLKKESGGYNMILSYKNSKKFSTLKEHASCRATYLFSSDNCIGYFDNPKEADEAILARGVSTGYWIRSKAPFFSSYFDTKQYKYVSALNIKHAIDETSEDILLTGTKQNEVYQNVVYPFIKGTCQSSLCVDLRTSDYITLLKRINTLLDRKITLKAVDPKGVFGSYSFELSNYGKSIDLHINMLNNAERPEQLPFEM